MLKNENIILKEFLVLYNYWFVKVILENNLFYKLGKGLFILMAEKREWNEKDYEGCASEIVRDFLFTGDGRENIFLYGIDGVHLEKIRRKISQKEGMEDYNVVWDNLGPSEYLRETGAFFFINLGLYDIESRTFGINI